jgi:hypothetical protein
MGWLPKWPVAGLVVVKVRVTFENSTSVPPVTQTWSVEGPLDSKGAGLPLPVILASLVITKRPVVAGVSTGQALVS